MSTGLFDQPLCAQIRFALGNFASPSSRNSASAAEYDKKGTELWNAVTRSQRDDDSHAIKILPLLRSFALALLHVAHQLSNKKSKARPETTIRILRTSLKAAKTCIDGSELDLATDVFQRAADYVDRLTGGDRRPCDGDLDPVETTSLDLTAEYWILRATLSWKQARRDLAEIYLSHVTAQTRTPDISVKLADLAYEIGKDLLKSEMHEEAVGWLDRASKTLESLDQDHVSQEALELRSAVLADMVLCFIAQRTEDTLQRAADIVSFLDQENTTASRLGIHLLKFQLLEARDSSEPIDFHQVLMQMIGTTILSPQSFKTIMYHVQKLHKLDPTLAQESLETLISVRLFEHGEMDLIEKAAVMRVWIAAQAPKDSHSAKALSGLLLTINDSVPNVFSEEATHAAQTLLWKCIEIAADAKQNVVAEKWCRLANHNLFSNAGHLNRSKIARKMMIISLASGNLPPAREAFYQMPQSGQDESASQYLLYRVALREGNDTLTNECLAKLIKAPESDTHYLYACVQEAQQLGSKHHALKTLRNVLERSGSNVPPGVHLPALLRCTIQLMLQEIDQDPSQSSTAMDQICQMFEAAVAHFKKASDQNDAQEAEPLELEWVAKTSYNTALRWFDTHDPGMKLALLSVCLSLMDLISLGEDVGKRNRIVDRKMLCHYLAASVLIVQARSDDNIQSSEQHYVSILHHCSAFSVEAAKSTALPDTSSGQSTRAAQLHRYEIEALIKLRRWDDLDDTLERCLETIDRDNLDILADLIITAHTVMIEQSVDSKHQQVVPRVMQGIINQSWQREGHDLVKLSRWLRCVFRMTVSTSPATALRIVEQAAGIASKKSPLKVGHANEESCTLADTFHRTPRNTRPSNWNGLQAQHLIPLLIGFALRIQKVVGHGLKLH